MKHKIFLVIMLMLFVIICCNSGKNRIYKLREENIKVLLKSPHFINESPLKKYVFVCGKAVYAEFENDRDVINYVFPKDINLNGTIIKKDEKKWWFIYDFNEGKILYAGVKLTLLLNPIWDEVNNYFIFNSGMSNDTNLAFYNLVNIFDKNFVLDCYYENKKTYLFNKNLIAYISAYQRNKEDNVEVLSTCIKIRDLNVDKDIAVITPIKESGFYELIRWETDKVLLYKEKDNDKVLRFELK